MRRWNRYTRSGAASPQGRKYGAAPASLPCMAGKKAPSGYQMAMKSKEAFLTDQRRDAAGVASAVRDASSDVLHEYSHGEERPLRGYALILGTYAAGVVAASSFLRLRRRTSIPERPSLADLLMLTVATHISTRLIAKDAVTAVLRAPFTRFEESAGEGEVNESVRARGLGHAVGELLVCPFCLAVWVATALGVGMLIAPRATRWAAGVLCAIAGSDYLQFAYSAIRKTG